MNKKSVSVLSVFIILAVIYIVAFLFLPFPKGAASWISCVFMLISFAAGYLIADYAYGKEGELKSKIYAFPVFRLSYIYPIAQFILSVIICAVASFVKVPFGIALVLSVVLLGAAAIGVIAADNVRDMIEDIEAEEERVTRAVKTFNLNIASIVDLCVEPEQKKALEKLAEDFRFSDPVSSDSTEEIENRIEARLNCLKLKIPGASSKEVMKDVDEIKMLLADRNRLCKAGKK